MTETTSKEWTPSEVVTKPFTVILEDEETYPMNSMNEFDYLNDSLTFWCDKFTTHTEFAADKIKLIEDEYLPRFEAAIHRGVAYANVGPTQPHPETVPNTEAAPPLNPLPSSAYEKSI